ncbi:hypothetical protein [Streptomyces sp. NPDC060035]|uniref:hypothetical protein n=1 Tax=Streptomyces sp. NPDC060035 TaxID=3347044 RepID=UPI0036B39F1E
MPHNDNGSGSGSGQHADPDPVFELTDFDGFDERQFSSEPLIAEDASLVIPPPVTGAPPAATTQDNSAASPGDGSAG